LVSLFEDAAARYKNEDWSGAIETLEQVRGQNPNYRRDDVEVLLVASLVNLANKILSEAPDPTDVYDETMALFDKAVKIRPQDESVLRERALAKAYLQGLARFQEEDWEGAVEELRFAYEHDPGYAAGKVVELLYLANIRCGDGRAEAEDFQGALACYGAAAQLPVDDVSEADTKYAALLPMLTPSPTPRPPAPTATPAPRPTPTSTPTPIPTPAYQYRTANVGCYHSGDKFIEGTVWESGAAKNGVTVRLSWAPDAAGAADYVTGTDPGRPGYYLHPRSKGETGTYYLWVVDASGKRISEIGSITFNNEGPDSPTACWRGVVDFVRNL
jgi:tetratricopeptide (TPR) repeat protein